MGNIADAYCTIYLKRLIIQSWYISQCNKRSKTLFYIGEHILNTKKLNIQNKLIKNVYHIYIYISKVWQSTLGDLEKMALIKKLW